MKTDDFFYKLTPDIVLDAVSSAGFSPTGRCLTLNSYENRVFETELFNNPPVVIKFYRPNRWSENQILEEHGFLLELLGNGFPACAPLELPHGSTLGQSQGLYYAVWSKVSGRQTDELTDENLRALGRLLAELHNTASLRPAQFRPVLDGQTYGLDSLEFLESSVFIPDHLRERYSTAVRKIVSVYSSRSSGVPLHRIHGDCHLGNLLNSNDGWFFLDFDDFLTGPAVQDIWMIIPGRDEEAIRQRNVLLSSYRIFRDFDESWLSLIEPLRALRIIHFSAWIAQRWEDPSFPRAFLDFNTLEYWENEINVLEDIVENLNVKALPEATDEIEVEKDKLDNEVQYSKNMTKKIIFGI